MSACHCAGVMLLQALVLMLGLASSEQQDWSGDWIGYATHWPGESPLGPDVQIKFHIGPMPNSDHTCTEWVEHFFANGSKMMAKDYMYCRGKNATDIWIDEGKSPPSPVDSGLRLPSTWMGDMLVSTFKYKGVQLSSTTRLSADGTLTEEMITFTDNVADPSKPTATFPLDLDRFIYTRASRDVKS